MTFGQSIAVCLQRKYARFSGRASRSEFWWFMLFELLVFLVASLIHDGVYLVAVLALLLPGTGVGVRRLHDVGRSGWWMLLYFVPLVGFLVLLYWNVQPSQPHANAYGELPDGMVDARSRGLPPA